MPARLLQYENVKILNQTHFEIGTNDSFVIVYDDNQLKNNMYSLTQSPTYSEWTRMYKSLERIHETNLSRHFQTNTVYPLIHSKRIILQSMIEDPLDMIDDIQKHIVVYESEFRKKFADSGSYGNNLEAKDIVSGNCGSFINDGVLDFEYAKYISMKPSTYIPGNIQNYTIPFDQTCVLFDGDAVRQSLYYQRLPTGEEVCMRGFCIVNDKSDTSFEIFQVSSYNEHVENNISKIDKNQTLNADWQSSDGTLHKVFLKMDSTMNNELMIYSDTLSGGKQKYDPSMILYFDGYEGYRLSRVDYFRKNIMFVFDSDCSLSDLEDASYKFLPDFFDLIESVDCLDDDNLNEWGYDLDDLKYLELKTYLSKRCNKKCKRNVIAVNENLNRYKGNILKQNSLSNDIEMAFKRYNTALNEKLPSRINRKIETTLSLDIDFEKSNAQILQSVKETKRKVREQLNATVVNVIDEGPDVNSKIDHGKMLKFFQKLHTFESFEIGTVEGKQYVASRARVYESKGTGQNEIIQIPLQSSEFRIQAMRTGLGDTSDNVKKNIDDFGLHMESDTFDNIMKYYDDYSSHILLPNENDDEKKKNEKNVLRNIGLQAFMLAALIYIFSKTTNRPLKDAAQPFDQFEIILQKATQKAMYNDTLASVIMKDKQQVRRWIETSMKDILNRYPTLKNAYESADLNRIESQYGHYKTFPRKAGKYHKGLIYTTTLKNIDASLKPKPAEVRKPEYSVEKTYYDDILQLDLKPAILEDLKKFFNEGMSNRAVAKFLPSELYAYLQQASISEKYIYDDELNYNSILPASKLEKKIIDSLLIKDIYKIKYSNLDDKKKFYLHFVLMFERIKDTESLMKEIYEDISAHLIVIKDEVIGKAYETFVRKSSVKLSSSNYVSEGLLPSDDDVVEFDNVSDDEINEDEVYDFNDYDEGDGPGDD